ncbi:MAG: DUF2138 family protein [Azonexus sp.]|jgi:uncharacterized protein YfaA (DUF2138 family)|nr:DUF2138 family protein [Azonexus sp.]
MTTVTTRTRKLLLWASLLIGAVAIGATILLRPSPYTGQFQEGRADISLPDALIRSSSLSRLPPDLLRIPLARDVLTEDFVAYYEENENRVALAGALRRIAYEHELDFPEKLLESVFDEPAEVALWRDDGGRLKDFVVVLSRNTLARVIQALLPVAAKATDIQLSLVGKLDGTDVDILALQYGSGHTLLLLTQGERIVVLSSPGMLLGAGDEPQSEKAVAIIKELLTDDKALSPFARHFLLEKPLAAQTHELTLAARAFALDYQAFVPGLKALNLSFDHQGKWQSAVLLDGAAWNIGDGSSLWSALPHGPGFCAVLPMNWPLLDSVRGTLNAEPEEATAQTAPQATALQASAAAPAVFTGPAAVCWYKGSRLYAPLFAGRLSARASTKERQDFFALAAQATKAGQGEIAEQSTPEKPAAARDFALWQGKIASPYGWPDENGTRYLTPALAIGDDLVFFSPNAALVSSALDVAAKRYPALTDSFGNREQAPLAFIDPAAAAAILRDEIFISLPVSEEAIFRNAADAYLIPRLEALARYPAQRIEVTEKVRQEGIAWYPLAWQEKTAP